MVALCACSPSDGQDTPRAVETPAAATPPPAQAAAQSFCLNLISARKEVQLGEPLTLLVELHNCSKAPQRVRDMFGVEFGVLGLWMRSPGSEKEDLYRPPVRRDGRGTGYVDLAPGDSLSALVPVYLGASGWTLQKIGPYRFRAEYGTAGGIVRSDSLEVSVIPPSEKSEASRALMSPAASRYLLLEGGDPMGRDELLSVAKKYPRSVWGTYANMSLAIDAVASTEATDKRTACRNLEKAAAQVPDWVAGLRGYQVLLRCLQDTGDNARARGISKQIIEQHPPARGLRALHVQ